MSHVVTNTSTAGFPRSASRATGRASRESNTNAATGSVPRSSTASTGARGSGSARTQPSANARAAKATARAPREARLGARASTGQSLFWPTK
jgi:hypothetical protein